MDGKSYLVLGVGLRDEGAVAVGKENTMFAPLVTRCKVVIPQSQPQVVVVPTLVCLCMKSLRAGILQCLAALSFSYLVRR